MELLQTMRFCCKTENFTKSAQFWSKNVSLVLAEKTSNHTYFMFLTINNGVIWSLKLPNHALFSPLLHNVSFHKRTVRALLSRMSISACVFLTGKLVTRPWYSFQSIVIFIDRWNSSVTHDIAKNRQLLRI